MGQIFSTGSQLGRDLKNAIQNNDGDGICRIIEQMKIDGVDKDRPIGSRGEPPVMLAVFGLTDGKGKLSTLETLVNCGCNIDASLSKMPSFNPLYQVVRKDNSELAKYLLDHGANVNYAENAIDHPLTYACGMGYINCVELLLEAMSKSEGNISSLGMTPLSLSIQSGHKNSPAIIGLLGKHGFNISEPNERGKTALHALAEGMVDTPICMEKLIELGCDLNFQNSEGNTALITAVTNNKIRVAKSLLDAGADVTIANYVGKTALLAAKEKNGKDMEQVILPYIHASVEGAANSMFATHALGRGTVNANFDDDVAPIPLE